MSVSNLVTSLAMGKDFKGECAVLSFVLSRAKRWMFIWTRINLSFFTSPSAYHPCCAPFPRWTSLIQQLFTVPDKETLGSSPARSLWTQTYFRLHLQYICVRGLASPKGRGGGGWVLPEILGRGVRPASQNPYPIYDRHLRFSLPYLRLDPCHWDLPYNYFPSSDQC